MSASTPGGVRQATRRLPEPNPVLVKELRARFRTRRAFMALAAFLLVLAATALLAYRQQLGGGAGYRAYYSTGGYYYYPGSRREAMGRAFLAWIVIVEYLVMAVLAPALTMNAVSGERERQTFELLLATPLTAWQIVRGKLGAALGYVLLMAFAVLPIASVAFLFGGVSGREVVAAQAFLAVAGLTYLSIGLFWSAWLKRSGRAAVASYLSVAMLSFGFIVAWSAIGMVFGPLGIRQPLASLLADVRRAMFVASPVWPAIAWFDSGAGVATTTSLISAAFQLIASAGLITLATVRVRGPGRGAKFALFVVAVLLLGWTVWLIQAHVSI
ncbi:MAG: ABC transporter permease [Anaerolineae bacterium]